MQVWHCLSDSGVPVAAEVLQLRGVVRAQLQGHSAAPCAGAEETGPALRLLKRFLFLDSFRAETEESRCEYKVT